ncbi:MAG: type II toxin-antitoxin system HicB family antitoxin [Candidatus Peribacteraceae bacterium]|nr:type II toxin-antitoxin system HicB family antitoxin [Candidatus Peribacteraceae bacterium]
MTTLLPIIAIEFIPDPVHGGFTAHVPDIPAYGEGKTEEEALEDLKVGIQAFIEENGIDATLARLNSPTKLKTMNFGDLVSHG